MKRIILLFLLVLLLLLLSCTTSNQPTIPQAAINEIYAGPAYDDEIVNKFIEIKCVEDKGSYCHIQIVIQPEECEDLELAFELARVFTDYIAHIAVITLDKYGINKDVFVWAQLPLGNNEVALLGRTWYDASSNTYEFKRYTEMN